MRLLSAMLGEIILCQIKLQPKNEPSIYRNTGSVAARATRYTRLCRPKRKVHLSPRNLSLTASSPNITEMVIEGGFLSALFYKIKEFTITLPPLRECQDDIMLLADFYLRHYNQEFRKWVKRFDASAQREMRAHSWSGNIRELKHVVRVAVLKSRGEIITPKELDFDTPSTGAHVQFKLKTGDEKNKITAAIAHADGNLTKAANLLGISLHTLREKRKKYGLI